jgi:hypothetical protein
MRRIPFVKGLIGVVCAAGAAASLTAGPAAQAPQPAQAAGDAIVAKARAIHERVMTLDTHNDISPANFTAERNYTQDLPTKVNLPKMFKGGLDASFFVVYVGQDRSVEDLTHEGYSRA